MNKGWRILSKLQKSHCAALIGGLSLFFLIAGSICADNRAGLSLQAGRSAFSGDLHLEPGLCSELGLLIPFSAHFELEGAAVLPFSYSVGNPEGQVFSAGEYVKSYSNLKYYGFSGGASFWFSLNSRWKFHPVFRLRFGSVWLYGGSKDGFKGFNTDMGAGIRYEHSSRITFELSFLYSFIDLTRLEINGHVNELSNESGLEKRSLTLCVIYYLYWRE